MPGWEGTCEVRAFGARRRAMRKPESETTVTAVDAHRAILAVW